MVSTSVSVRPGMSDRSNLAPIALFVYNRPGHTQRTVNSIRENESASHSDLFVFSDGAKNEAGSDAVQQVRRYIRTIRGFRSVTIIERERNWGLADSVISGITDLCNQFGRVIVMEDDLLTTPDFLTFINQALKRYESEPKIFSVSGFNFGFQGPEDYPYDAFSFYRSSSLGWGTWLDRWRLADWTMSDYHRFCADREQQRRFNRGGDDLSGMLAMQMHGKSNSWAVRWAYTHFKHDALALLSFQPRVFHIGSDRSATHSRWSFFKQLPLTGEHKSEFHFPDNVGLEKSFVLELQKSFRPSLARKLVRYLLHGRLSLTTNHLDSARFLPAKTEPYVAPNAGGRSFND